VEVAVAGLGIGDDAIDHGLYHGLHGRERGTKVVGNGGEERAAGSFGFAALALSRFEGGRHFVEGRGDTGGFIVSAHGHTDGKVSGGEACGGSFQVFEALADGARHHGGGAGRCQEGEPAEHEEQLEVVSRKEHEPRGDEDVHHQPGKSDSADRDQTPAEG
jgi:hypothetical protein